MFFLYNNLIRDRFSSSSSQIRKGFAMGGYRSGRKRTHPLTTACTEISIKQLKPYLTQPGDDCVFEIGTMSRAHDMVRQQLAYVSIQTSGTVGDMRILYIAEQAGQAAQDVDTHIRLVTTPCNYGGHRWWFEAPCCGARVGSLYIGVFLYPACRTCCNLHYASQMATPIERHIAREKHLLRHYGFDWAKREYNAMPVHYFEVTPAYKRKKQRSEAQWYLRKIRVLISFNRQMYSLHVRQFATIRTMEDRATLLAHYLKEWGCEHTLSLLTHFRETFHRYASYGELDAALSIISAQPVATQPPITQLSTLLALKSQFKQELIAA